MGIPDDIERLMYFDGTKLMKLYPEIIHIKKGKIIEAVASGNFEQGIILSLPDKREYSIKLILQHRTSYRAELNDAVYVNDFSIACITTTNFNDAIAQLISKRYHSQYSQSSN